MEKLNQYLNTIESRIPFHETVNLSVSKATIGWQIDHSLKVIIAVSSQLIKSNPKEYQWKFNKSRFIIYTLGFIPRGKGKAPKQVQSCEIITLEDLNSQLETANKLILELKKLPKKSNFNHPLFSVLDLKQTIYFLLLHTKHHLKIIEDILSK